VIHYAGRAGTMTCRSFHAAARWTYSEGDQPLRRVRYKEQPEGLFLPRGDGENAFHRPPDDIVVIPRVDPLKMERRRCVSCDVDFFPARPWSRFCSSACRLRAHRRLPRQDQNVQPVLERPRANSGQEALAE
jgi:ferredoxin